MGGCSSLPQAPDQGRPVLHGHLVAIGTEVQRVAVAAERLAAGQTVAETGIGHVVAGGQHHQAVALEMGHQVGQVVEVLLLDARGVEGAFHAHVEEEAHRVEAQIGDPGQLLIDPLRVIELKQPVGPPPPVLRSRFTRGERRARRCECR